MIDIHSHILHGIADSPPDIHVSLEIAKLYQHFGFTHVVSTPHYNPAKEDVDTFLKVCNSKYFELKQILKNLKLTILPGAEVMLCPELLNVHDLSSLCLNHSRYMLVEFPWDQFPSWAHHILFEIGLRGIVPILAHPERNNQIYKNFARFQELIESGLLIQINGCNILSKGKQKQMVKRLFSINAVTLIASDIHAPDTRLSKFKKAISIAKKNYGTAQISKILNNAEMVIRDDHIEY